MGHVCVMEILNYSKRIYSVNLSVNLIERLVIVKVGIFGLINCKQLKLH